MSKYSGIGNKITSTIKNVGKTMFKNGSVEKNVSSSIGKTAQAERNAIKQTFQARKVRGDRIYQGEGFTMRNKAKTGRGHTSNRRTTSYSGHTVYGDGFTMRGGYKAPKYEGSTALVPTKGNSMVMRNKPPQHGNSIVPYKEKINTNTNSTSGTKSGGGGWSEKIDGAFDKAYNYLWKGQSNMTRAKRIGTVAGAWMGGNTLLRHARGGDLGHNPDGENDIAGIPFI